MLQHLHPGHVMAKYKVEKPCYHCKEKKSHHRRLGPRLINRKNPPPNSFSTAPPLVECCAQGQSRLSAGEQVIMQTALFEAMDQDKSKSKITRFLRGTGSQRTYILKKLSKIEAYDRR